MARRRVPKNVLFAMIVLGVCIFGYLIITFIFLYRDYIKTPH